MSSIFTKIINGEIPCYKIAENDDFFAFLDMTYLGLMNFSKKVALAIEKSVTCNRVGMTVIGLEVPHVHVHLIPLNSMNDIDFKHKVNLNEEEFKAIANKISSLL